MKTMEERIDELKVKAEKVFRNAPRGTSVTIITLPLGMLENFIQSELDNMIEEIEDKVESTKCIARYRGRKLILQDNLLDFLSKLKQSK